MDIKVFDVDAKGKEGGTGYEVNFRFRLLEVLDSETAKERLIKEFDRVVDKIRKDIKLP